MMNKMLFFRTNPARMYLPRKKKEKPKNPFKFERSRNFVVGATGIFLISISAAALLALRRVQERQRETVRLLHQRHKGNPRVVIIGAGPCGSALAASVTRQLPQTLVTVIEKDKLQVFYGQVPHAHVGHRSYDVNTSGGWDFLRSPTTWNVTREALLVPGSVVKVDPVKQEVMVREEKPKRSNVSMKSTSSATAEEKSPTNALKKTGSAAAAAAVSSTSSGPSPSPLFAWLSPFSFLSKNGSILTPQSPSVVAEDGSCIDATTGLRVFPYDVLVIASGAERTLGSLDEASASVVNQILQKKQPHRLSSPGFSAPVVVGDSGRKEGNTAVGLRLLRTSDLEKGSIALHPGTTRDLLAHLFKGEVLHVKVPPASFVNVMRLWQEKRAAAMETGKRIGKGEEKEGTQQKARRTRGDDPARETLSSPSVLPDVASASLLTSTVLPCLHHRDLWSLQRFQFPTRQDDATFVSTTNLIWKFLCYFNKLYRCPLRSISADAAPFPAAGAGEEEDLFQHFPPMEAGASPSSSLPHSYSVMTSVDRGPSLHTNNNNNNNPYHSSSHHSGSYFFSEWNSEVLSFWRAHQDWGVEQSSVPDLLPPSWGTRVQHGIAEVGKVLHHLTGTRASRQGDPLAAQLATAAERAMHHGNEDHRTWDATEEAPSPSSSSSSSSVSSPAFCPLHCTYVEGVDPIQRKVLLVHYPTGRRYLQPYRVLLLDLPMKAAGKYIEVSGLHRPRYVEEVVLPQVQKWKEELKASSPSSFSQGLSLLVEAFENLSLSQIHDIFQHEASFANVDPETLQHRQYRNIFAIGDAAGLPTMKSYAAGFTQVPVVTFNIQRVLQEQQERKAREAQEEGRRETSGHQRRGWGTNVFRAGLPSSPASLSLSSVNGDTGGEGHAAAGLARYNGYTSFHVVMTPWRCMWPAFTYGTWSQDRGREKPTWDTSSSNAPALESAASTAVSSSTTSTPSLPSPDAPLLQTSSTSPPPSWRGLKGMTYGFFCQSAMYELLYFFVYMRGLWYPPRWFMMPTFSPLDGSEVSGGSWLKDLL